MTEFRKYKPRELMQGLLEGKIYQYLPDDCVDVEFFKMNGNFLLNVYLSGDMGQLRFTRVPDLFYTIEWYSHEKLKEVSGAHVKLLIQTRRKELKSEKGC